MKMKRGLWICGALLCVGYLWGQKTGSQDRPDLARYRAENEALAPPAADTQRVVFFGDSITDAWGRTAATGVFFPGKPYVNRGISGQTTPQMLVRFQQDVVHLHPSAVVILAGTNDVAGNTGTSTQQMIEDNYASMAAIAKQNGIKVVFASITPAFAYPWKPGIEPVGRIRELNKWLQDFCAKNGCVYLDYYSSDGGREGRYASGSIFRRRTPDSTRVRRDGAVGRTCDCPGIGPLRLRRGLGENEFLEGILVDREVRFPSGKFVEAENVSEEIGGLRAGERARGGCRHQFLDHVVEIERGLALVFGEEFIPAERRIWTHAIQRIAMARCALRLIGSLASMRLIGGIQTIAGGGIRLGVKGLSGECAEC